MAWVYNGDRRVYCFEAGTGQPVVLLHGMALAGMAWSPQVASLVRSGYRVLVPDMAGHGASSPPDEFLPFGINALVGDVRAVLDASNVETADLVGISMGGTTALAMAALMPDRVRRIVVANAGPSTNLPALEQTLKDCAHTSRGNGGPLALLDKLWSSMVSSRFSESDEGRRTYQHWKAVNASVSGAGMAFLMEGVAGFDGSSLLEAIKAKTLFIAGSEDPAAAFVRQLPDKVCGAGFTEILGAKHIANVDEAHTFTRLLLEFLS